MQGGSSLKKRAVVSSSTPCAEKRKQAKQANEEKKEEEEDHAIVYSDWYASKLSKLQEFEIGEPVLIKHPITKEFEETGKIERILESKVLYEILLEDGGVVRRTRRYIKPTCPMDRQG